MTAISDNNPASASIATHLGRVGVRHRLVGISGFGGKDYLQDYSGTSLEITMEWIAEHAASCLLIVGGALPYVPQYLSIKKARNSEGFSTLVCLTLLIANILRILFWFGRHFESPLLIQSFLMNLVMLSLVKLCVETRPGVGTTKMFTDFRPEDFWKWTDFLSYIQFLAVFTTLMSALTYLFIDSPMFIETLGLMALLIEAMLAMPQLLHNARAKSTAGMSVPMVLLWTVGDVGKTIYFVLRDTPKQFWICGFSQIAIDLLIMLQVVAYKPSYR